MTVQALPRIIRFIGTTDAPDSQCPHCGARGRFIIHFVVEDGRTLGAMRGCVQLFPASQIAREDLRLMEKAKGLEKKGWHLNRGDTRALEAIERFYAGEITEREALNSVEAAKRANVENFKRRQQMRG